MLARSVRPMRLLRAADPLIIPSSCDEAKIDGFRARQTYDLGRAAGARLDHMFAAAAGPDQRRASMQALSREPDLPPRAAATT